MAPSPSSTRVRLLSDHLGPMYTERPAAAVCASASAAADSRPPSTTPLTEVQLQSFVQTGFVSVSVLDDLGPDWVARFYERCVAHEGSQSSQPLFQVLSDEVNELLNCPAMVGGLTSLLGPDYLLAPGEFANDGLKLHRARPPGRDQGFHRDGTDHGPTQR